MLDARGPARKGAIDPKTLPGVVVDDEAAERTGFDTVERGGLARSSAPATATTEGRSKASRRARFVPDLPAAGTYEVRLAYTPNANRASNVAVSVTHAADTTAVTVNQRKPPAIDGAWVSLGSFRFEKGKGGSVEVRNDGADGFVVIDAVQWLPAK